MSTKQNAIAVSHRKDADGICSASLISYMTGSQIFLTDYGDMAETLSQVGAAHEYYISDSRAKSEHLWWFPRTGDEALLFGAGALF